MPRNFRAALHLRRPLAKAARAPAPGPGPEYSRTVRGTVKRGPSMVMLSLTALGTDSLTSPLSFPESVALSSSSIGSANSSLVALSSTVPRSQSSTETFIPSPGLPASPISVPSTPLGPSSSRESTNSPHSSSSPGRHSSTVIPVASSPTTSDTVPDRIVSSIASERSSVTPHSAARSTVLSKPASIKSSTSVKMAAPQATVSSTSGESAQISSTSSAISSPPTTTAKAPGGGQDPTPPQASQSSESSSASSSPSSSRPSSISTVISTSASSASRSISTPESVPTGPSRPAGPDTPKDNQSSTSQAQGTPVVSHSSAPPSIPTPHNTAPTPEFIPSPDSSVPSSSENGSKGAPGIVQANAKTPTTTSTITDKPETTLSSPVFVTVTDAQSHTSLSIPPVFTSVGVSTLPDGDLVSVTHVIANPTGIWGVTDTPSHTGFFANTKAVAGVFLVVGIIVAGIGVGICLILRRRRRRTPRFLNTISRPLPMPDNPFEDPRSLSPPPEMRYASGFTDRTLVIAGADGTRPARSPFDDDMDPVSFQGSISHNSHKRLNGLSFAGIGANGRRTSGGTRSSMESRRRNPSGNSSVGVALTSDQRIDASRGRRQEPSSARSSPSLYPPTLPALHGEDNQSLIDVPLSTNNSTTRVGALPSPTSNGSSTRIASPTTRKPVPAHADLPEPLVPVPVPAPVPLSPAPRTPQQQQTKPPVIPPRSPLRRNSTIASRSLSRSPPPPALASIQTQLRRSGEADKLEGAGPQAYEPLTPPASFSSASPSGSQSGHEHEPPSPSGSVHAKTKAAATGKAGTNPFSDAQTVPESFLDGPPKGGKRDTFYSRVGAQQRRPSVEWKD